jgi:U32 family peptidase
MQSDETGKIELVAPAGNLEKLRFAIVYGADAVYLSGKEFGLRARAGNFSLCEMDEGVRFAHEKGAKAYLTLNIFARNRHIGGLEKYLDQIKDIGIDAVIVSDPGIFSVVRQTLPDMKVHISTQANTTNWRSIEFWRSMGAERVVCARELGLDEIGDISKKSPIELEAFVHGAMCISYSGRCLLSSFMSDRSANEGECTHPCRWKYRIEEQERPGETFSVEEDDEYTYIFSSRDLCMIEHLPKMVGAGLSALKIEGRMKSAAYHALVTRAYRRAIDAFYKDPENFRVDPKTVGELDRLASRGEYSTGFYFGPPKREGQIYDKISVREEHPFLGYVLSNDTSGRLQVKAKNKISFGDRIEFLGPDPALDRVAKVTKIYHEDLSEGEYTFADETVYIEVTGLNNGARPLQGVVANDYDIIRKEAKQ